MAVIASVLRTFEPESPFTRSIFHLGMVSTVVFALIFLIVSAIVLYAITRPGWREGEPDPHQLAGNTKLEMIWTAIPFFIVVGLTLGTAYTMKVADPAPPPNPDIIVAGHQWWWDARYPKSGVVVANELHIPAGKPVAIRLDATDVLHEFWVPELARKITAVPGHSNYLWIQADKPGTYVGFCSEFCGTQHAWMHFLVVATPEPQFAQWEQAQLRPATAPAAAGSALAGASLFQQMSCVNCHAVNGTNAKARVGPDLTHVASRLELGAGVASNTPENLRRWLSNPQEVKPGVKMPNYNFTQEQLTQLVDYLRSLQ
jgi:cytochrome c oxidase subunit 2